MHGNATEPLVSGHGPVPRMPEHRAGSDRCIAGDQPRELADALAKIFNGLPRPALDRVIVGHLNGTPRLDLLLKRANNFQHIGIENHKVFNHHHNRP